MTSLRQMKNWGMGLVILGIMFGVALAVLGDVADQLETDSDAEAAVDDAINAIGEFTGWFGLIVLVVVAGIIISLVQRGFGGSQRGRFQRGRA